jgi:isopentenyl diphosphate isomerase/L-lactate dehydrogenase-like FMN-dependent dehydrogenase
VDGRVPVMIDSGFRRGTDIFKALAMGADAVCIGRPYIWGLAAFGQAGVEKILQILKAELARVMGQIGARTVAEIGRQHIGTRSYGSD